RYPVEVVGGDRAWFSSWGGRVGPGEAPRQPVCRGRCGVRGAARAGPLPAPRLRLARPLPPPVSLRPEGGGISSARAGAGSATVTLRLPWGFVDQGSATVT